jgi:hypothetical protein
MCLVVLVSHGALVMAASVPISDYTLTLFTHELTFHLDPIDIEIGGTAYNTGDIAISLDPDYGLSDNFVFYDFSDGSTRQEWHTLFSCSLFDTLGVPAQKLFIAETGGSGCISVAPGTANTEEWTDIAISYNFGLTGIGTFEEEQFLAGWTYHNVLTMMPYPGVLDLEAWIAWQKEIQARFKELFGEDAKVWLSTTDAYLGSPTGTFYGPVSGDGTATLAVPEPAMIRLLLASLFVAMFGRGSRRTRLAVMAILCLAVFPTPASANPCKVDGQGHAWQGSGDWYYVKWIEPHTIDVYVQDNVLSEDSFNALSRGIKKWDPLLTSLDITIHLGDAPNPDAAYIVKVNFADVIHNPDTNEEVSALGRPNFLLTPFTFGSAQAFPIHDGNIGFEKEYVSDLTWMENAAAHEFGHVLGLDHDGSSGGVMDPDVTSGGSMVNLNSTDRSEADILYQVPEPSILSLGLTLLVACRLVRYRRWLGK